ncbi:MAG: MlaD family protein [Alphaproteobacteria bacterium]|nr:MlaD family protein [Alphaproteobacteria bacterium]
METRASYLLVGSFVLAVMAASVVFVIWLTGAETEKTVRYYMRFEGSVTGLQIGSQVRFRGIPVGEVTTMKIVEDDTGPEPGITIEVAVDIREDTPIRENTRAVLEVQGITGVSFVQLTSEPGPSEKVAPSTRDKKVYILTKPSSIERIFKNFPELLAELTLLATQGRKLLNDDNLGKISRSLTYFEDIAGNLSRESDNIGELIEEGRELVRTATPALESIAGAGDSITNAADQMGSAARAIRGAAREMEVMIKTNQQPIADFMATGLYDLSQFFVEARQLVGDLTRLSKKMESDPARFFFGDQHEGYRVAQ